MLGSQERLNLVKGRKITGENVTPEQDHTWGRWTE